MDVILFYIFAGIALIGAMRVVMSRPVMHCALWLLLVFLGIAGLYVLLDAEFIATVQVIIFAGTTLVLILFVIMVTRGDRAREVPLKFRVRNIAGILLGIVLLAAMGGGIFFDQLPGKTNANSIEVPQSMDGGTTPAVAEELFTDYLFPFETLAVFLLLAMVGAVNLAEKKDEEE